jgi:hypothetical protein
MKQADFGSDPAVVHFVITAKAFCRLLELKRRRSERRFVEQVLKSTLALYGAGMELSDIHPESGYARLGESLEKLTLLPLAERIKRDPKVREHAKLHRSILGKIVGSFGDEYPYRKVFEPFDPKADAIWFSVSDDLADIYCDIKKGLVKIRNRSGVPSSVVWQWKFGFESHWGRHAVSAIAALHLTSLPQICENIFRPKI